MPERQGVGQRPEAGAAGRKVKANRRKAGREADWHGGRQREKRQRGLQLTM